MAVVKSGKEVKMERGMKGMRGKRTGEKKMKIPRSMTKARGMVQEGHIGVEEPEDAVAEEEEEITTWTAKVRKKREIHRRGHPGGTTESVVTLEADHTRGLSSGTTKETQRMTLKWLARSLESTEEGVAMMENSEVVEEVNSGVEAREEEASEEAVNTLAPRMSDTIKMEESIMEWASSIRKRTTKRRDSNRRRDL